MTTTLDPAAIAGESRMLIDGQLVEAENGRRFANVNPATEEVLGETADAGHGDMDRAIAAARRAFDTTDWSTDRRLRKRCLFQLAEAPREEAELLRAELVAEVGTPVLLTYGPQLDAPLAEGLTWPARFIDEFDLGARPPRGRPRSACVAGARWSRRRWAWWRPSCRGTTPSRCPSTRSARPWPPATRSS